MANKIKFGLSNVYYALATIANDGTATYETPVAIPGAVNISLDPEGESTPFYADNLVYFVSTANTGYSGTLEIAKVPDSFRTDVLGDVKDSNDVFFEDADAPTVHFALLFQFEGDQNATKHVMYNCTATRASVASETKGETIEPGTETLNLTCGAVKNTAIGKNVTKSFCDTPSSTPYNTWNTAVYMGAQG